MKKEEIEYLIAYYSHLLPIKVKSTLKYPYLNDLEREAEKIRLANIINKDYGDKVFWNLCPKCKALARTPFAKQCKICKFDWH